MTPIFGKNWDVTLIFQVTLEEWLCQSAACRAGERWVRFNFCDVFFYTNLVNRIGD